MIQLNDLNGIYCLYLHNSSSESVTEDIKLLQLFFQGAGVEADGLDGGGEPAASFCQRPHLPRQLHLCQLRLRDVHVS